MRRFVAEGQRLSTIRQYERLERALTEELGVAPSEEAVALRRQVISEQPDRITLIDRTNEREVMQQALDEAQGGAGSFVLLTGVPGIGKTALGEWLIARAESSGWISGRAVAASVDGPGPYAPVLEAIDDLLRSAPELLDNLPATHRAELMRVREAPGSTHDGFGDDDGHQRLFVAVDELVRLASQSRGLVLFIDDVHAADDASLALLHYIARQATRSRLLLVGTARSGVNTGAMELLRGLVGRQGARELPIGPFGETHSAELIREIAGTEPTARTIDKILSLSGGTPFYVAELTKSLRADNTSELPDQLAAIAAASGSTPTSSSPSQASKRTMLSRSSIKLWPPRFSSTPPAAISSGTGSSARASCANFHLIAAEQKAEAAPWALLAARAAQAVGALTDALAMTDSVLDHADRAIRVELLTVRADILAGMGDPGAVAGYQSALAETEGPMTRLLRAKMARAALMGGDAEAAQAALAGLEPDGGPFDGPLLHAQGMLAYFGGDLDTAEQAAEQARQYALSDGAPTALLDVLTLQGMVAHNKGEWFDRMRVELTSSADSTELAATVFDCHL